ncbi:MAG: hypothetical protein ACK56I_31875, partial [bacterium]
AISRLTQGECILHGDFAASCGEGLSHFPKVGMEGSGPSKEFAPHSDFSPSRRFRRGGHLCRALSVVKILSL